MKKATDFIVEKRNIILIIFIILTSISIFTATKVNINSDISKYLPKTSETKIGKDIMEKEFEEIKEGTLNVMFKNLSNEQKQEKLKVIKEIQGIDNVEYDESEEYNKGSHTLYKIKVKDYAGSETSRNVYEKINKMKPEAISGTIYDKFKPVLQIWIIVLAITMAMIILTILSDSYIEPWLYLFSIGIAVFINKGTNKMFPSVSNITDSITAILQLALSMDYSIMLSNRYKQERKIESDKLKAMKSALYDSFKAILSSSITTVVGLLALVFMSFTIGKDLGFVLAKGVFLSLVSIFLCLPALLLIFDNRIMNSKKKSIEFNLSKLGTFSYKTRWFQLIFIIIIFIVAYLLKGNVGILYTDSQKDEIGKVFSSTNQIAIVYKNEYEDQISQYARELSKDEKANQVLAYGTTLNEKLAYNEVNDKLKDLGKEDTKIDDYLLKLIYYNYYNKNTKDSMTLDEFIKFIKSDIYDNKKVSEKIEQDQKNNINRLENFSNKENVLRKRPLLEISNILEMNEKDANNIMILYNAKYNNSQITIEQFVNYIIDDVSKNPEYKDNIDAKTLANLKQLKTFINKQKINEQMTASELAEVFGINKITVEQLLLFNRTTQNSTTTMTINEFAKFALSLKNETQFQSIFTPETISKLTLLQTLSNDNIINQKQTSAQLEKTMKKIGINNLDQSTLNLLYFYNYYKDNPNTSTKLSLNEFTKNVLNDNNIKTMLPSEIEQYKPILNKFSDKAFITTKLNSSDMAKSMKPFGLGETQIKQIYATLYIQNINPSASSSEAYNNTVIKLTPYELLNIVKTKLPSSHPSLKQIQMLINIMDLSYNQAHNIVPKFTSSELSTYLSSINNNINNQTIALGYSYNDYKIKSNKTMSVKQIINFLEKNKTDPIISSKIGGNASTLTLAYKIINNTETKFNKIEMSNVIGQPESIVKNIYNVADYKKLTNKLTPKQFVNLILNNKNNPLIKSKLINETIIKLNLVNKVMESIEKGTKYTANELSNIFGTNKEKTSLIISLYKSEDNKNQRISLKDFTTFIINDVITNKEFLNKINEEQKTKLKIVNGLINGSISGTKYNSLDLYNILKQLTDKLDYNLVDMVYIYNGSQNKYNESWKMTIEEIINYVSSDILNNEKYSKFIDNDMREKIEDSKVIITDAKKLLITDKYSRVLINSKYPQESKATFDFVQKIKEQFFGKEGIYVIGNSPMALEISKTFNQEMDYITILTIIFIFIVVALTFKDILISIILVVIIQTAVYITMTTLSISGSSVYFIALLIVQSILMGATIDYGIVYTTYYKELRKKMGIKDAMINSYNKSIHTIISSSSILIIVTLIVSAFAEAIPAQICKTISQGTIASAILILFILPGVLAKFDKIICRKENKINKQK